MKRTLYRWFGWALWVIVPVTAARLWMVWNRLPARIATHFDFAGRANGWTSPTHFAAAILLALAAAAAISTLAVARTSRPDLSSWSLLGFFYVMAAILYGTAEEILNYNLYGRGVHVLPFLIAGFAAALVMLVIYLGSRRGPELPPTTLIAEEVHGSAFWAFIIALPGVLLLAVAITAPSPAARLVVSLPILLLLMGVIMAGSGFHYVFSRSGLEIRTMGFRLRTIPASQIRDYAVDNWSRSGGYGIRGVGNQRAYVWGKKGVRIHLWDGEVFLGHCDPERLVRDLDAVTNDSK